MTAQNFRFSAIITFALLSVANAYATDWPQWRGPLRDGVSTETGLLKSWPEGGPPLAWKASGLGLGYSGVAIAAERIYTMGDLKEGSCVIALEEKTGRQLWSTRIGTAGAPGGFDGPRCTPTVDGDRIYVAGQLDELACLNLEGVVLWEKSLLKDFAGGQPGWGFAESPLVDGELLLYTPGGSKGAVVALNKKTGDLVWRTQDFTDEAHYSSIIIAKIGGVRQYVKLTDAHVVGIAGERQDIMEDRPSW